MNCSVSIYSIVSNCDVRLVQVFAWILSIFEIVAIEVLRSIFEYSINSLILLYEYDSSITHFRVRYSFLLKVSTKRMVQSRRENLHVLYLLLFFFWYERFLFACIKFAWFEAQWYKNTNFWFWDIFDGVCYYISLIETWPFMTEN